MRLHVTVQQMTSYFAMLMPTMDPDITQSTMMTCQTKMLMVVTVHVTLFHQNDNGDMKPHHNATINWRYGSKCGDHRVAKAPTNLRSAHALGFGLSERRVRMLHCREIIIVLLQRVQRQQQRQQTAKDYMSLTNG